MNGGVCAAYKVMGLPQTASTEEVRARYLSLARKHHPDKLKHLSVEEIRGHETIFKEVATAYRVIEEARSGAGPDAGSAAGVSMEDWARVWFNVRDHFKEILAAAEARRKGRRPRVHRVALPVTLEEVQFRRKRKVMLTLTGCAEPIFVEVDCGDFPLWRHPSTADHAPIDVHMTFAAHAIFESDHFDDETWDLFYDVPITLTEYFNGGSVTIPGLDGTTYEERVFAPFPDVVSRIDGRFIMTVKDAALWRLGTVYVTFRWTLPTAEAWERARASWPAEDPPKFMAMLQALDGKNDKTT
jgi:DnaJ-class molecular chaperone